MASEKVKCPLCGEEFSSTYLRRHVPGCKKNPNVLPKVRCTFDGCDRELKTKQSMKSHFDAEHSGKKYTCKECDLVFEKKQLFDYHNRTKHAKKYKCPVPGCEEERCSKKNLQNHIDLPPPRGHGGVVPTEETVEEIQPAATKRKAEETDPVKLFLYNMRDRLKDSHKLEEGSKKFCAHLTCVITDLAYGFKNGDKIYCSKHKYDKPNLVNLGKLHLCRYVGCKGSTHIKIGGLLICEKHMKQLVEEGLPSPETSVKKVKDSGPRCIEEGCGKYSSYDNGKYCVEHSPTKMIDSAICVMPCCMYGNGSRARFFHPDHEDETSEYFGKRICTFASRALIEDALHNNDMDKVERLMEHFKLKRIVTLNAQNAFRFQCEKRYHTLLDECVKIVFDGHVHEGPKTLNSNRPDIFYKFTVDQISYGIHIEYDECSDHEDDPVRLQCIAKDAGCEGNVYVIRVNGGQGTKNPVCEQVHRHSYMYHRVTSSGKDVASLVSDAVVERIQWIKNGLGPGGSRPDKISI